MSLQLSILGDLLGLSQDEQSATPINYQANVTARPFSIEK